MPITTAEDGFRLWYEVDGEGPAIVFPVRYRSETAALAGALADGHRVVRYKPREAVGVMEPDEGAGGDWEPASFTQYPIAVEVADLHSIADAAGVSDFVLGGYSGMAAHAGFLAPISDRAVGLMIGGFPLLSGIDYWRGYVEGARTAVRQAGLPEKANEHQLGVLLYRAWSERDDRAALRALSGPKIVWYGTDDSEPGCRMYEYTGGAAIARRIRADTDELHGLGFEVIELDGQDHIGGMAATDVLAPRLATALTSAPW